MTNRERVLRILDGKAPDRVPWIPRLLIWHQAQQLAGTLPERYRNMPLREIERDLGMGTPARDGRVFRSSVSGVQSRSTALDARNLLTELTTPAGVVTTRMQGSDDLRAKGIQDLQVEFMLRGPQDYAVAEYITENTTYAPTYEEYAAYEAEIGDDGYPLVSCGDCPFHHWMRALVGYGNAFYHLNDHANEVERLLAVMSDRDRSDVWHLIADSPARLILHGVHFSSQMTPPHLFERYIEPYYRDLSALLRSRGKVLALHADNDSRHILENIRRAGFGMAECFATHPMVETTLSEARAAWGDDVIVWGGVPSTILEDPYTDEQFESAMEGIFRDIAPGTACILGVSDNIMPDAKLRRIRRIGEMVQERGAVPIAS